MRSLLAVVCVLTLVNCSDSDKGDGAIDPKMRGVFSAEGISKSDYSSTMCPSDQVGDMDTRLNAGMVFESVSTSKYFDDKSVSASTEQVSIQSIDHDKNFFVAKHVVSGGPVKGWFVGKTQFQFDKGWSTSQVEFLQVSPNLQPLINKAHKGENDDEQWTSCVLAQGEYNYETKIEDGTFTFADGRVVKAQQETRTQKGEIECVRMQHVDGQAPKELSRTKVGPGVITYLDIKTLEVPSTEVSCAGKISSLYYKNETKLDSGETLIISTEELTKFY